MYSTKHPLMTTDARYTPAAAVDAEDADAHHAALVPPPSFRARCRSAACEPASANEQSPYTRVGSADVRWAAL